MGLVGERQVGEWVLVLWSPPVLHVFEDGVVELHALSRQQAQIRDHSGHRSSREGTPRESDQNDLVAVDVVRADVRVGFSYVLEEEAIWSAPLA